MRHHRAFRPTLVGLEDRVVPSLLSAPSGDGPAPGPPLVPIVPTVSSGLGNGFFTDSVWGAIHDGYAAQAVQGSNPVVFLGDSITYFWGGSNPSAPGAGVWRSEFAPLGAADFGIMGDLSGNVLWRVEHGEVAGKPGAVVLMVGINDLTHGRSVAETAGNIAAVVGAIRAQSPGTDVLLLSVLPTRTDPTGGLNARVTQLNAAIAGLADGRAVRYLDVAGSFLGPDGEVPAGLLIDGIHPSAAGYQRLATQIIGPLRGLLGIGSPTAVASPPTTATTPASLVKAPEIAPAVVETLTWVLPLNSAPNFIPPSDHAPRSGG